jgi:hypothetical protein
MCVYVCVCAFRLIKEEFTIHMTIIDSSDFSISQQFAVLRRLFDDAYQTTQKNLAANVTIDPFNDSRSIFEKIIAKDYSLTITVQKADAISNLIKMKLQYGKNRVSQHSHNFLFCFFVFLFFKNLSKILITTYVCVGFNMIIYGAQEAYLVIEEIHLSDTRVIFTDIGFTDDSQEKRNFEKNILVRVLMMVVMVVVVLVVVVVIVV